MVSTGEMSLIVSRSSAMVRPFALSILASILVAGCAVVGTSSPTAPAWTTFSSNRLGYSLLYPPDWTTAKATSPWVYGNHGGGPGDPTVDQLSAPDGVAALVVAAQAIPASVSESDWWNAYNATMAGQQSGCAPPLDQWETIVVDGQTARVHGGLAACDYTEAVALVGRRAYVFTAYADVHGPSGRIFDRKIFNALLATVHFEPDRADDAQPASPS